MTTIISIFNTTLFDLSEMFYKKITGFECPKNGGKPFKELNTEQKAKDHEARMVITEILGHSRKQIVKNYCG
jgi:hypothetical protein